jgi:type I restriction enzyme S subunit
VSWVKYKLGDVCDIARGGSPRPISKFITKEQNGINWIKIADATRSNKYIYKTKEKIKKEGISRSRVVNDGDFLLSNSMSFGRPYIMRITGCIHDGWLVLSNYQKYLDIDFFYYLLSSSVVVNQFENLAQGSTVRNLNKELVSRVEVMIPPLLIQKKIVLKLDKIFAEIDKAIAATETNIKNIDDFFQSYLTNIFEKMLLKNKSIHLKNICLFENGDRGKNYPSKKHQVRNGIPFINAGDLKEHWKISRNGMAFITQERFNLLSAGKVKIGDVLFCLRGSLGKCGIVEDIDVGAIASSLVIIRPLSNKSTSKYIYWFLSSSICSNYINNTKGGTAQPNLSAKKVMDYLIPLLDIKKQLEISDLLDSFYLSVTKVKKTYINKIDEFVSLKRSILLQVLSDELVKAA